MRDPCTRFLGERSMKDPCTGSPDITGPSGKSRPLWETSLQEFSTRSLDKTSARNFCTRCLWTSWQNPYQNYERSLCRSSLRDLLPRLLWFLWRIPIQDPCTTSRDTTGPLTEPLSTISLQKFFARSLAKPRRPWEIYIQDLLISLGLLASPLWEIFLQELSTRSLHKTSMTDLCKICPDISGPPGKTSMGVSLQELSTRPLGKTSVQDLYIRSPDIPGPPDKTSMRDLLTHAPDKISWQARRLWEISIQDLLISLDLLVRPLWELCLQGLSTRSLAKTSIRDPCTRSPDLLMSLGLLARPLLGDLFTRALHNIFRILFLWSLCRAFTDLTSMFQDPCLQIFHENARGLGASDIPWASGFLRR